MASRSPFDVDADQSIDAFDPIGTQLSWPRPVSRRLDQLTVRARAARSDRSEVAAAIISAADYSEEDLVQLVADYRTKRARDIVLGVKPGAKVLTLPRPGPGRRRRSG